MADMHELVEDFIEAPLVLGKEFRIGEKAPLPQRAILRLHELFQPGKVIGFPVHLHLGRGQQTLVLAGEFVLFDHQRHQFFPRGSHLNVGNGE